MIIKYIICTGSLSNDNVISSNDLQNNNITNLSKKTKNINNNNSKNESAQSQSSQEKSSKSNTTSIIVVVIIVCFIYHILTRNTNELKTNSIQTKKDEQELMNDERDFNKNKRLMLNDLKNKVMLNYNNIINIYKNLLKTHKDDKEKQKSLTVNIQEFADEMFNTQKEFVYQVKYTKQLYEFCVNEIINKISEANKNDAKQLNKQKETFINENKAFHEEFVLEIKEFTVLNDKILTYQAKYKKHKNKCNY